MNILRNRNSGNEMLSVRLYLVDVECQINLLPETMSTMVATPYVNHVATMTGGVGFEHLARFYKVPLDNNRLQNWSITYSLVSLYRRERMEDHHSLEQIHSFWHLGDSSGYRTYHSLTNRWVHMAVVDLACQCNIIFYSWCGQDYRWNDLQMHSHNGMYNDVSGYAQLCSAGVSRRLTISYRG